MLGRASLTRRRQAFLGREAPTALILDIPRRSSSSLRFSQKSGCKIREFPAESDGL